MVVMILEKAKDSLRGELTRWMIEAKTGVFIGSINAAVRERLWQNICTNKMNGAVMVYSTNNEQGFKLVMYGNPKRSVIDMEGISLIKVLNSV